jgi:CBS domain-containing protein
MIRNPTVVSPDASVMEVARLMREKSIGSVILVEDGKPIGIVTERDLVHRVLALGRSPESLEAFDISTKPVIAISEVGDVDTAITIMNDYKIRRVVVVDVNDSVVGILTTDDIGYNLRNMSEELAVEYLITMRREKGS